MAAIDGAIHNLAADRASNLYRLAELAAPQQLEYRRSDLSAELTAWLFKPDFSLITCAADYAAFAKLAPVAVQPAHREHIVSSVLAALGDYYCYNTARFVPLFSVPKEWFDRKALVAAAKRGEEKIAELWSECAADDFQIVQGRIDERNKTYQLLNDYLGPTFERFSIPSEKVTS